MEIEFVKNYKDSDRKIAKNITLEGDMFFDIEDDIDNKFKQLGAQDFSKVLSFSVYFVYEEEILKMFQFDQLYKLMDAYEFLKAYENKHFYRNN